MAGNIDQWITLCMYFFDAICEKDYDAASHKKLFYILKDDYRTISL